MAEWAQTFSLDFRDNELGGQITLLIDGKEFPWHIARELFRVEYTEEGYALVHMAIPVVKNIAPALPLEDTSVSWGKPGDILNVSETTEEPPGHLVFSMEDDGDTEYPFLLKGETGWNWYTGRTSLSKSFIRSGCSWDIVRMDWKDRKFVVESDVDVSQAD